MDRVKTGIPGFDGQLEGGFPRGRTILVSGGCGTGKTIFAMQYAYMGAMEYDEPAVFVTLDERPNLLREDMARFGWDLDKAEKKGKFVLIDASSAKIGFPSKEKYAIEHTGLNVDKLMLRTLQVINEIGAKRVVIDSLAGLGFQAENETNIRKAILKISYMLSKPDITTLLTSEIPEQTNHGTGVYSKYGVEEYVADGVIVLHYSETAQGAMEELRRTLFVRKMRGTKHTQEILSMSITNKGIIVRSPEEAFETPL